MKQLYNNLNQNDGVEAKELKHEDFFNINLIVDRYYKKPESGSVTRTHIFLMSSETPGQLFLRDSTDSEIQIQDLKKGKDSDDVCVAKMTNELATMKPMIPPGVEPIKQVELGTKWRRLVPEEY